MKHLYLIAFAIFVTNGATAQIDTNKRIMEYVEQMPEFKGDMKAYFNKHLQLPDSCLKVTNGRYIVRLVIGEDGKVQATEMRRGLCAACDATVLAAVKAMPAWTPGKQNGKPLDVLMTIVVDVADKRK